MNSGNLLGLLPIALGILVFLARRGLGRAAARSYHGVGIDLGERGERAGEYVMTAIGVAFIIGGLLMLFVADG